MIPFTRFAFFTVARDAGFVTLAAVLLMLAFSFEPPLAFEVGATVALIFSLGLLVRGYLPDRRTLRAQRGLARAAGRRTAGRRRRPALGAGAVGGTAAALCQGRLGIAGLLYCSALVLSASMATKRPLTPLRDDCGTQISR